MSICMRCMRDVEYEITAYDWEVLGKRKYKKHGILYPLKKYTCPRCHGEYVKNTEGEYIPIGYFRDVLPQRVLARTTT